MSNVFVIDTKKQPFNPVHPARARVLLTQGKAAVFRRYPFTIILKQERAHPKVEPLRLKIDPGSKTTGLAVVNDGSGEVLWAAELTQRGQTIKAALESRRATRRSRRQRKTRYRKPRFNNRLRNKKGWLPPSLMSRIHNALTWVARLRKYAPLTQLSQELVRFDLQLLEHPAIQGVEYQQGTLQGYEVREYLLEKWGRKCVYCGVKETPLEIEHILCRKKGGSHRINNLTISCKPCNQKKGTQDIRDFLKEKPDILNKVVAQAKPPLKDATAVNATRWELYRRLQATGLPVEVGTGGRTKYNRTTRNLDKAHWIDAACVGASTPVVLLLERVQPLLIRAMGHGRRQMCVPDTYGFPKQYKTRQKISHGYQTGDMVKARIPKGKYAGTHVGRIAIRRRPSFRLHAFDVHPKYLTRFHQQDGYEYQKGVAHSSLSLKA